MRLGADDVWGHFAPMFHLVDAFAVYAITAVGGRHVISHTFSAGSTFQLIGEKRECMHPGRLLHAHMTP